MSIISRPTVDLECNKRGFFSDSVLSSAFLSFFSTVVVFLLLFNVNRYTFFLKVKERGFNMFIFLFCCKSGCKGECQVRNVRVICIHT